MAQNQESDNRGARIFWAASSPVIIAAGFFIFPFIPAIAIYLDGRSRTYTAAACTLIGCAALPYLLGAHAYSLAAFIAVATAAAYVLARLKVPFSTGLMGSAAGGVLGAMILLGLLSSGFDKPLNEVTASLLCNEYANLASAGYPGLLSSFAGMFEDAKQNGYLNFSSFLFEGQRLSQLVEGKTIAEQIGIIRPYLEAYSAAYIPAFALVGGMLTGALGYYLPVRSLDKRRWSIAPVPQELAPEGDEVPPKDAPVPPFTLFKVPRYIVIVLLLLQMVSIYTATSENAALAALSTSASMLFTTLMTVQALSLFTFYLTRKRVAAPLQFLLLALSVLFLSCLLPYVGIFDALFDMRTVIIRMDAVRSKGKQVFTPEGLEELRKMEQKRKGARGSNGKNGSNSGKNGGEGGDK
jgi:hypothetical protein